MWDHIRSDVSSDAHQQRLRAARGRPQDTLGQDILGISSALSKYEIRAGKMVPQVTTTTHVDLSSGASPAHLRDPPAASVRESVQQANRQRLRQQLQQQRPPRKSWLKRSSGWRPTSSVYSDADDAYASDDVPPPRPQFSLTSWGMSRHAAKAPVSPLSSPEPDGHAAARDVSPINAINAAINAEQMSYQAQAYRHATALPNAAGAVSPGGRPPWKGASGRSNILPPLADDLYIAPLTVRRGGRGPSSSTRGGDATLISASETNNDGAATMSSQKHRPLALNQGHVTASTPSKPLATGPRSYPSTPDSASLARSTRPHPRPPPPPPSSADRSPLSPHSLATDTLSASAGKINRKPAPPVNARTPASPRQEGALFLGSRNPVARDAARARQPPSATAWVLPSSRFSVTTCATSIPDTPRQSVVPPLPIRTRESYSSSVTDTGSLSDDYGVRGTSGPAAVSPGNLYSTVDRAKSPVERRGDRTPRTFATMDAQSIDCRSSILSMAKPLPLAPPELSASQDRVAQLNAYIQSLIHRRLNISKSIQQMTELMPRDSLFATDDVVRKREVEKLKVQALRHELAEIQREEYDAGFKLHRAHKRMERDAEYEPTALWVRRVTG